MKKGMLFEAVVVILVIFLSFVLYLMIAGSPEKQATSISGLSPDPNRFMFVSENDTLYTIDDSKVVAVSPGGMILWSLPIEDWYGIGSSLGIIAPNRWSALSATTNAGNIYMIITPAWSMDSDRLFPNTGMLLAISDDGHLLWSLPLLNGCLGDVMVSGNNIYVYHDYNVTAMGRNGSILWSLNDVASKPVMDENGYLYVLRGDLSIKSIESYCPNGTLYWSQASSKLGVTGGSSPQPPQLQYKTGTLYVFSAGGSLIALNRDGSERWSKGFQDQGIYWGYGDNIYAERWEATDNSPSSCHAYVSVVYPNGTETSPSVYGQYLTISNGIVYESDTSVPSGPKSIGDLNELSITAYDVFSGKELWGIKIPIDARSIALNESNVNEMMPYGANLIIDENRLTPDMWYAQHSDIPYGTKQVVNSSSMSIYPGTNITYVSICDINYEYPAFFGHSNCTYAFGIYAYDKNGDLVWQDSTSSQITGIAAGNGTVFYNTGSGGLSAARIGTAAGFAALVAAAYMFFRFFAIGAVAPARSKINENMNRNSVLEYIRKSPGSTLSEISRATGMNLGTLRYHTFILGLNHRIVLYRTENKFVRYFPNSGSYTREEQMIISLMKRDGMGKMLCLLLENPGMTNAELSRALGVQESAVSRWTKELLKKGVIERVQSHDGRLSYAVKAEYSDSAAFAIEHIGNL